MQRGGRKSFTPGSEGYTTPLFCKKSSQLVENKRHEVAKKRQERKRARKERLEEQKLEVGDSRLEANARRGEDGRKLNGKSGSSNGIAAVMLEITI
jgi:hypothetical protein